MYILPSTSINTLRRTVNLMCYSAKNMYNDLVKSNVLVAVFTCRMTLRCTSDGNMTLSTCEEAGADKPS